MKEYCTNSECILREFCQKAQNANGEYIKTEHHPIVVRNVSSTKLTLVDVICKGWKKRKGIPEIKEVNRRKYYVPLWDKHYKRPPKIDPPLPF